MTYMEQFPTAEAYVLHQITRNRGSQNCISKADLIRLAEENHVPVSNLWSKSEIAAFLMDAIGVEKLCLQPYGCEFLSVSAEIRDHWKRCQAVCKAWTAENHRK